jgi:trimethylamine--corrinoid protein Co-methyltransferase
MLRILDKSDLDAIHGATLEVLRKTGVMVKSDETLRLLESAGHQVDRKTCIVRMPETLVMEAVKSCRPNFRWHARSKEHTVDVVDGRTKVGPGAQCLFFIDPHTNSIRPATMADGAVACRLMDAIDSSSFGYVPIYPHDVPESAMSALMWVTGFVHSSKLAYGSSGDPAEFELMLRVAEILLGDREKLRRTPMFPGYIDPISPLGHDTSMTQTILRHMEWDSPVFVTVMALAGGTAPASIAGLLVQQNAEVLSSIAIARCASKRPKIVYGSVSCPLDMRSGIAATGAPEFSLIGVGAVQLAKYYRLPSNMGVQSDSKTIDAQTTYEKTIAATMAFMAGADFSELFLGSTESFNAFSPIQMMIDDEIVSNITRIARGIEISDETLSVDVIAKTGPMGNFLKQMETLKHFRREHQQAILSDRTTRQQWTASGSKDTNARALARMKDLLDRHVPEPLSPDMRRGFDRLIGEYSKDYSVDTIEKLVSHT